MEKLLSNFSRCRILLAGDFMLDEYLWGDMNRISPEAPVPILGLTRREATLGGAGNVARNLRSLGARVIAAGALGGDGTGEEIRRLLGDAGIDCAGIFRDASRKSTRKTRFMSSEHNRQVFRVDDESSHWISGKLEKNLLDYLLAAVPRVDAVLCSDYGKGVLTEQILQSVLSCARQLGVPSVVAPKDPLPRRYANASVLVPNLKELSQLVPSAFDGPGRIAQAAATLFVELNLRALVVTRGSEGISLFEKTEASICRTDLEAAARAVYDVTGAGDTVVSVLTLSLAAGADYETAARLGNAAGGIVIGKRGTACVTREELRAWVAEMSPAELVQKVAAASTAAD